MAQRIAHRTSNPGVAGSNPAGGVFFVVLEESSSQTKTKKHYAATGDRTWDLQIFSLTLSQLSYSGSVMLGEEQHTVVGMCCRLSEKDGRYRTSD